MTEKRGAYPVMMALSVGVLGLILLSVQTVSADSSDQSVLGSVETYSINSTCISELTDDNESSAETTLDLVPPPERFALIIVSNLTTVDQTEVSKAVSLYQYLLVQGWEEENIDLLGPDQISYSDGIANVSNVAKGFDRLIDNNLPGKEVLIHVSDHIRDNNATVNITFTDGIINTSEMGEWLDDIICSRLTFVMTGNRSGSVGPEFCGPGRDIICSMNRSAGFVPDQFNITRGLTNPRADTNHDGVVSFVEAYYSERVWLLMNTQQVPELW